MDVEEQTVALNSVLNVRRLNVGDSNDNLARVRRHFVKNLRACSRQKVRHYFGNAAGLDENAGVLFDVALHRKVPRSIKRRESVRYGARREQRIGRVCINEAISTIDCVEIGRYL